MCRRDCTKSEFRWGRVKGWCSVVSTRTEISSHPSRLHAVGQHDQSVALLFPHQTPEITHSVRQGTLGCNKFLGAPETLVEESRRVKERSSDDQHPLQLFISPDSLSVPPPTATLQA